MKEKTYISWGDIETIIRLIETKIGFRYKYVTGVPRGGIIPAILYSHQTGVEYIPYTDLVRGFYKVKDVLVIDDIADTGKTVENLVKCGFNFITLYKKTSCLVTMTKNQYLWEIDTESWLVFPWERKDSKTVVDNL